MQRLLLLWKIPELRAKVLFVLAVLAIFRIGAVIPVPGIDPSQLANFLGSGPFGQIFGLMNVFTGGALDNLSIVMLGVGPYITATIIMQLLTMIFPRLKQLYYEEGEQGRRRFNQISRYLTVPLAALQGYGFLVLLQNQQVIPRLDLIGLITSIVVVAAGSVWLMWLGELISEKGIGNGISLLIFAGIIAGIPNAVGQAARTFDQTKFPEYVAFLVVAFVVIAGVVFINEAQRNIPVNYAKRVRGTRMYGGVSTHLPLRVNQAGVIPIIFALSILLFPGMVASFLANIPNLGVIAQIAQRVSNVSQNSASYSVLYFILVFAFTYFYTAVTFDPKEIALNLQKQGGYVPGVRPGSHTASFLSKILNRTTLAGAIFLGLIAVLPSIVQGTLPGVGSLTIGGTAVLIVVSVVLETMKQIDAQLVMREYEGF